MTTLRLRVAGALAVLPLALGAVAAVAPAPALAAAPCAKQLEALSTAQDRLNAVSQQLVQNNASINYWLTERQRASANGNKAAVRRANDKLTDLRAAQKTLEGRQASAQADVNLRRTKYQRCRSLQG